MAFFRYLIDIVDRCNLRCLFCPRGNSPSVPRLGGAMPVDLYESIVDKIRREAPNPPTISLFNWTEPFLHPQLPELIRIARLRSIPVDLSSNLNSVRHLDEVIKAGPSDFRISVSGFHQDTYVRTHANGDIEKVKENMRKLRDCVSRLNSKVRVQVAYLCYLHNLGDDYDRMAAFCRDLGFMFAPSWAYLMPLEKCLDYYEGGDAGYAPSDWELLAVDPDEAKAISLRHPSKNCRLRDEQLAINSDGSVALCCGVYDVANSIAPSFMDVPHDELQAMKYRHPLCERCMKHGMHVTATYGGVEEWNALAAAKLHPEPLPKGLMAKRRSVARRIASKVLRSLGLSQLARRILSKLVWGLGQR